MATTLTRNTQSRFVRIYPAGFVERGRLILRPVGLSFRRRSLVTCRRFYCVTVGRDPLFRRLRGVLSDASGPKGSFRSKQAG